MKKNILKKTICFILFIIMGYLFIYFGTKNYTKEVADNIRFSQEFSDVSENNLYKYINADQILDLINNQEDAIILMGFSSNTWSHKYASILNDVALLRKINKLYYYDFKKDRGLNVKTYNNIVKYLDDYLYINDTSEKDLSAPTIVIIKNGKILYFNNDIKTIKGNITADEYFDDYHKNLLINELDLAIKNYLGE